MAFFEKIGGAITSGVSATANKTKEISGSTKDSMELSSKKKELNALYGEIGKVFVNEDNDEKLKELKGKAIVVLDEIEALEEKMADAKGMKKCEQCGQLIDNASVFCAFCGGKQENITNKCPKCKTILPEGTLFCVHCGTKQNVAEANVAQASAPVVNVVAQPAVQEVAVEPVIETVQENVQEKVVEEVVETVQENVQEETVVEEKVVNEKPIIEEIEVPKVEIKPMAESSQPKNVFCTNCGHKAEAGVKFCTECGNKL